VRAGKLDIQENTAPCVQFQTLALTVLRSLGVSKNCAHATAWLLRVDTFCGDGRVSVRCDTAVPTIEQRSTETSAKKELQSFFYGLGHFHPFYRTHVKYSIGIGADLQNLMRSERVDVIYICKQR
jgi:hypothetical protein